MSKTITYTEALEHMRKAVEVKGPDHVYREQLQHDDGRTICVYFNPDATPSCLVGHVLAGVGVTLDDLDGFIDRDGYRVSLNTDQAVNDLVEHGFIQVDPKTEQLLATAQTAQDHGAPWGDALKRATTH
jgi:hypothetical protein